MSFMKKELTALSRWIEIDGPCGIEAVPFDVVFPSQSKKTEHPKFADVENYTENTEAYSITVRDGYGARLSAPGYMDCTPWSVFDTAGEAEAYLDEEYMDDEGESL